MTDRTDHRAKAEVGLSDAIQWGRQAGELSCLAYAAIHALLAIHDTLTASNHRATNEEQQQEEELEDAPAPDPLDESDHRTRHDNDGSHWRRGPHGWYLSYPENGIFTLTDIDKLYGPLEFCDCEPPNAAGKARTAPLSASGPFGALVDPPSPDSAPEAL